MSFFALFKFCSSIVIAKESQSFELFLMKKNLLLSALAIALILVNPIFGQSKETAQVILNNHWVKKYKKLKNDLEDKAGFVKTAENISAAEKENIKEAYQTTSKMLDSWLDHLLATIEKKDGPFMQQLSEGNMDPELKEELLEIFAYYSSEFQVMYEEVTGQNTKMVISHSKLMSDNVPSGDQASWNATPEKILKEYLISNVKQPLRPAPWNALF